MGAPFLMLPFRSPAAAASARGADGESWEVDLKHNGPLGRTVVSETPVVEMPDVHTQLHATAKCL